MDLQNNLEAASRFFSLKSECENLPKVPKHLKLVDHNDVILICEYIEQLRTSGTDMLDVVTDLTAALNNIKSIVKSGGKREQVVAEIDSVLNRHSLPIL